MIQQQATVLWNQQVGPACFRLGLSCPNGYEAAVPGQFVMVQIETTHTPLLRRPFSIFKLIGRPEQPEGVELLYKSVGRGTLRLAQLTPGCSVDLLGPLGRGFQLPALPAGKSYLVAGGMGVAPIHFLAVHMKMKGLEPGECRLFLGGRSRDELLCREEFAALGMPVTVTTDDGSSGDQCLITDPLEVALKTEPPDGIYACGPHGMLQCVAGLATRFRVACQLSLETMMACGIGACLGCAVPRADGRQGYRHVCSDGPVFRVGDIEI